MKVKKRSLRNSKKKSPKCVMTSFNGMQNVLKSKHLKNTIVQYQ